MRRFASAAQLALIRAIVLAHRPQFSRFLTRARRFNEHQQQLLASLLRDYSATKVGRDLSLPAFTSDWRSVPTRQYSDLELPILDAVTSGRSGIISTQQNPVAFAARTSGTTGPEKFVPVTVRGLKHYRRMSVLWGQSAFSAHPAALTGTLLQLSGSAAFGRHASFGPTSVPVGSIGGYAAMHAPLAIRRQYCLPGSLSQISDPLERIQVAAKYAIADPGVSFIGAVNPSSIQLIVTLIRERWEDNLREIAVTDTKRARFLAEIDPNSSSPAKWWPKLALIATWQGGLCHAASSDLRRALPQIPLRDHGYVASEGRFTIPTMDNSAIGILTPDSTYYEFIPESEYGSRHPTILSASDLMVGQTYYIILTSDNGLIRYDIKDAVECCGWFGEAPMIRFRHKSRDVSSFTGEKLSADQVARGLDHIAAESGIDTSSMLVVTGRRPMPHYVLLIDHEQFREPDRLAISLDQVLCRENIEYSDKRASGRLGKMIVLHASFNTISKLRVQFTSQTANGLEQTKPPVLIPAGLWDADLLNS